MAERATRLTNKDLELLSRSFIPNLPQADQDEFGRVMAGLRQKEADLDQLRYLTDASVGSCEAELEEAMFLTMVAQTNLQEARRRTMITSHNLYKRGNYQILCGNVKVLLFQKAPLLPPFLRFLSRFGTPVHPVIKPHLERESLAKQNLEDVKNRTSKQKEEAQTSFRRNAGPVNQELGSRRRRLELFLEDKITSSKDLVEKFAALLPDRASDVVQRYTRRHYLDQEQVSRFSEFLHYLNTSIEDPRAIRQILRDFRPLFGIDRITSPEDFAGLEAPALEKWQSWITFTLLEDLAKKGVIEKPAPAKF